MANYPSSIRRIRRNEKSRQRNVHYKSMMKTYIKKVLAAESREDAESRYRKATSVLDKLVSKGIIHRNKAANQKARLARYVNSL
ncbi:MAG: 30S ribosomal protein S20 [Calditrichaeota bacterium]|nr:MAG: 30S ribosomal protein S20 [Calditrichota bacterium]